MLTSLPYDQIILHLKLRQKKKWNREEVWGVGLVVCVSDFVFMILIYFQITYLFKSAP
jgi:hypothetical protein